MKVLAALVIVLLSCCNGAFGTATLTASSSYPCVSGTDSLPVSGTLTMTCTATTATVAAVIADTGAAAIQFLKGTTVKFEMAAGATASTAITSQDTTNFPTSSLTGSDDGDKGLIVAITNFPSSELSTDWNCIVVAGAAVVAEAKAADLNLNTACTTTNAIALAVATTAPCVSGTASVPTGGAATFTCTFTTLAGTDIVPASGSANAVSLEIAKADLTAIYTIAASETATTTPTVTAANSDTASATVAATTITISTTALPAAALDSGVTCIAKGLTGSVVNLASPGVNLNTQCSGAAMNKMAGLLVTLLVAMKTLLF